MGNEIGICFEPSIAAKLPLGQAAEELDQPTAEKHQQQHARQQDHRGRQILTLNDLPLLARLLAVMRCCIL